jgi:SAM-dependent methyltransferase
MSFYSDFAEHYDEVFPFEPEVYGFLSGLLPRKPGRVLDVGCGTGDYCARFAVDGVAAVGIDLDPWMIATARKRHPAPDFRVIAMEDAATLGERFDLAYCIGNVAAHLDVARVDDFLRSVRGLLNERGRWVLQTVNWDFILGLETYSFPRVEVPGSGLTFERRYSAVSRSGTRFETKLLDGEGVVFEGSTVLFPVDSAEYVRLHERAGFRLLGHYGSFERTRFEPDRPSSSVFAFERAVGHGA